MSRITKMGLKGRRSAKWILITSLLVTVYLFPGKIFGYFSSLVNTERDYETEFSYPLDVDLLPLIESLKNGENPSIAPRYQQYNLSFIILNREKCKLTEKSAKTYLLIMVKSDAENVHQRNAIRISWGQEDSITELGIKRVFLVGTRPWVPKLQKQLQNEQILYSDLVQADFFDTYYNNTYKTMSGFKWAMQYCPNTEYVMFLDDDMYLSVPNLLHFLRNPTKYPGYLETVTSTSTDLTNSMSMMRILKDTHKGNRAEIIPVAKFPHLQPPKRSASEVLSGTGVINHRLYAGFVYPSEKPIRNEDSKWYIPTSEYQYDRWPPYVPAGAIVLTRSTLADMYYASFYTQPFRFDDIYVAILAKKIGIAPYHCNEFYIKKKDYLSPEDYKRVVVSHGFDEIKELLHVWRQQRLANYA